MVRHLQLSRYVSSLSFFGKEVEGGSRGKAAVTAALVTIRLPQRDTLEPGRAGKC